MQILIPRTDQRESLYYWLSVSPSGPGVYAYVHQGKVEYVGKTTNLRRRLNQHHTLSPRILRRVARNNLGDGIYFHSCSDPLMSHLEGFLIYTFQPFMNKVQPKAIHLDEYETVCMEALQDLIRICG